MLKMFCFNLITGQNRSWKRSPYGAQWTINSLIATLHVEHPQYIGNILAGKQEIKFLQTFWVKILAFPLVSVAYGWT